MKQGGCGPDLRRRSRDLLQRLHIAGRHVRDLISCRQTSSHQSRTDAIHAPWTDRLQASCVSWITTHLREETFAQHLMLDARRLSLVNMRTSFTDVASSSHLSTQDRMIQPAPALKSKSKLRPWHWLPDSRWKIVGITVLALSPSTI